MLILFYFFSPAGGVITRSIHFMMNISCLALTSYSNKSLKLPELSLFNHDLPVAFIRFNILDLRFPVDVWIVDFKCYWCSSNVRVKALKWLDIINIARQSPLKWSVLYLSPFFLIISEASSGKLFCISEAGHIFHLFFGRNFFSSIHIYLKQHSKVRFTVEFGVCFIGLTGGYVLEQQEAADKMQIYNLIVSYSLTLVSFCLV